MDYVLLESNTIISGISYKVKLPSVGTYCPLMRDKNALSIIHPGISTAGNTKRNPFKRIPLL